MKKIFILSALFVNILNAKVPLYFCTAADSKYFFHLLNLIGSIHRVNYDELGEIAVFDLGMTQEQCAVLQTIEKVVLYEVEKVHTDIIKPFLTVSTGRKIVPGWYAWKPVVIKQALEKFPYVLWIDAGTTVLRPLNIFFQHIQQNGYFLATIGMSGTKCSPISWGTTEYVKNLFNLNNKERKWILDKDSVMAGLIGVSRESADLFIMPLYKLAHEMRPFIDDGSAPDGFGTARYEQTLLSILSYLKKLTIFDQDETQKKPIYLHVDGVNLPVYITWQGNFLTDQTHIYSSRNDLCNFDYFVQHIHYKYGNSLSSECIQKLRLQDFSSECNQNLHNIDLTFVLCKRCVKNNILGCFVDCGVEKGAYIGIMAYVNKIYKCDKTIILIDEFKDAFIDNKKIIARDVIAQNLLRWNLLSEKFAIYNIDAQDISPLTTLAIDIGLLRIGQKFSEVISDVLEYFYPKMVQGAYIIIEDYEKCKKNVMAYLQKNQLQPDIMVDNGTAYWCIDKKSAGAYASSFPYITGDTFRALCDHRIDPTTQSFNVDAVKNGDMVYLHGDLIATFAQNIHPYIKNPYILLTHNSDLTAPGIYDFLLDDPKLICWFSLNPGIIHPKLKPIPLGHANKFCPSGVISVIEHYAKNQWKLYDKKEKLLYMNFSVCTNRAQRQLVKDFFESKGMCTMSQKKSFVEFMAEMSQYKFTLSPFGTGPDCHRTWEALLVGSIPIVLSSPLDQLFNDLPVLIVKDWSEITSEFLEKKYQEILNKKYNREKLYMNYWFNMIQSLKKMVAI